MGKQSLDKNIKKNAYIYCLIMVFLIVLAIRLYISFQTPNFSYEAYFTFRQVESIKDNLVPTYDDELSYSGRFFIFQPAYYYLIAPFAKIMGTSLALKVIPNILASLLVFVTFLIVRHITKNDMISLFSGAASGSIPIFFAKTLNSASSYVMTIPLVMYLMYCFMRIKEKKYLYQFIVLAFILATTSSIAFLFVLTLLIYFLLTKLEYKTENKREIEIILFVTFLVIWLNVLIYKKAFLFHSYSVIWQNIPSQILANHFKDINVLDAITGAGILPIIFGVFAIHKHMLKERDRRTYLLMASALAVALLLWTKMISFQAGLMFLGAILIPLFGQSMDALFNYIDKTKIHKIKPVFAGLIVLVFVLTSTMPSLARGFVAVKESVSQEEMEAMKFLREETPEDSTVLASVEEGHLITAIAKRKNVADDKFLLIREPEEIYEDIETIYKTLLKTKAVELLNKYDVDYVYFSEKTKEQMGTEKLRFAEPDCFEPIYDQEIKIYKTLCEIKTPEQTS